MPPPDRFVEFCLEQFAPLGRITSRYMFGGWCLYCDGAVFALIADGAVYLKGESPGRAPFRPFPDKELTMKYFAAPPEIFEDIEVMRQWCLPAIAASQKKKPRAAGAASRRPTGR